MEETDVKKKSREPYTEAGSWQVAAGSSQKIAGSGQIAAGRKQEPEAEAEAWRLGDRATWQFGRTRGEDPAGSWQRAAHRR